jgi:hypothetical protein
VASELFGLDPIPVLALLSAISKQPFAPLTVGQGAKPP